MPVDDPAAFVARMRELGATRVAVAGVCVVEFGAPPARLHAVPDGPEPDGALDSDGEMRMLLLSTEEGTG